MRKNMRAERARSNLTAEEVAKRIGVSTQQVYRWESGRQEPASSKLLALSRLYRCSPDYLMDLTDERTGKSIPSQNT
jgi:transcriptional regulator with XRE-family HTH domain